MSNPILLMIAALFIVLVVIVSFREWSKVQQGKAQAQAEQQRSAILMAALQGKNQKQLAEIQNKATAKDWIGGFSSLFGAVTSVTKLAAGGI